jgi:hypothetical protein
MKGRIKELKNLIAYSPFLVILMTYFCPSLLSLSSRVMKPLLIMIYKYLSIFSFESKMSLFINSPESMLDIKRV